MIIASYYHVVKKLTWSAKVRSLCEVRRLFATYGIKCWLVGVSSPPDVALYNGCRVSSHDLCRCSQHPISVAFERDRTQVSFAIWVGTCFLIRFYSNGYMPRSFLLLGQSAKSLCISVSMDMTGCVFPTISSISMVKSIHNNVDVAFDAKEF
ncbi:hypothetical protein DERF_005054 [Dermatophagoides farinae]|uniref:Uncharacterized protein n=1 Tax=Dermatophagoides farinae TaxID=6954 RepID=A0A922I2P3_DERFA|nr:hypothetical protein DERF_005054 [Dermatophagoides farinae]